MKKILAILVLIVAISACKKEIREPDKQSALLQEDLQKKSPPSANANPVFAFSDYYQINPNRFVPAIFVMDVTGANKTKVYSNYNNQTYQAPDFPAWSADGTQLCFT